MTRWLANGVFNISARAWMPQEIRKKKLPPDNPGHMSGVIQKFYPNPRTTPGHPRTPPGKSGGSAPSLCLSCVVPVCVGVCCIYLYIYIVVLNKYVCRNRYDLHVFLYRLL